MALQILQIRAPARRARGQNTSGKELIHPAGVSHLVISGQTITADQAKAMLRVYPTTDRGEVTSAMAAIIAKDSFLSVTQMDVLADIALAPTADSFTWTSADGIAFQALTLADVQTQCLANGVPINAAKRSDLVAMLVLMGAKAPT